MKAALSKNFPGAPQRTAGMPGQIPRVAEHYKNVSPSNKPETEVFIKSDRYSNSLMENLV
jgi:hypothetical protein